MRRRLKLSVIVGFLISVCLHAASAAITVLYPYHDLPMVPHLPFLFLLEIGWVLSGQPWPLFRAWQEIVAVVINGVVYSFIVFGLSAIRNWSRKAA